MIDIAQSRNIASLHYQIRDCDKILEVRDLEQRAVEGKQGSYPYSFFFFALENGGNAGEVSG